MAERASPSGSSARCSCRIPTIRDSSPAPGLVREGDRGAPEQVLDRWPRDSPKPYGYWGGSGICFALPCLHTSHGRNSGLLQAVCSSGRPSSRKRLRDLRTLRLRALGCALSRRCSLTSTTLTPCDVIASIR